MELCADEVPQYSILDAIAILVKQGLEPGKKRRVILGRNFVRASGHVFHNSRVNDLLFPGERTPMQLWGKARFRSVTP